jgi:hypothetical protein
VNPARMHGVLGLRPKAEVAMQVPSLVADETVGSRLKNSIQHLERD